MADFSTAELVTLRRLYLRDYVSGADKLSAFNRATGEQFITSADLNALKARVELDNQKALLALYTTLYNDRIAQGDSPADATAKATALQLEALYRLVRAEVLVLMLNDSAFRASIADEEIRSELADQYAATIKADRNFLRQRAGTFSSVDLLWR
jgi:hypothetical protein